MSCQTRKSAPTSCSTFIFLLILLVKANEFKFNIQSNQTQKRERVQTQLEFRASLNLCVLCVYRAADKLACSLFGALTSFFVSHIYASLYFRSLPKVLLWMVTLLLTTPRIFWMTIRFPGRPGMTMAVATGKARLVLDPTIFLSKIKNVDQTGIFLCKFRFIPQFCLSYPAVNPSASAGISEWSILFSEIIMWAFFSDTEKVQIPKVYSPYGFHYMLDAATSSAVRREDDKVTYINKGKAWANVNRNYLK